MNRRTVLLGFGAAGVGSGAVFGSGAFTSVEVERDFSVTVTGDASAALQLQDNSDLGGVTTSGGSGDTRLEIDLTDINEESTLTLGDTEDANPEAFSIINNTDVAHTGAAFDISVELVAVPHDADVTLYKSTDQTEGATEEWTTGTSETLSNGDQLWVAIEIDLSEADLDDTAEVIKLRAERV